MDVKKEMKLCSVELSKTTIPAALHKAVMAVIRRDPDALRMHPDAPKHQFISLKIRSKMSIVYVLTI